MFDIGKDLQDAYNEGYKAGQRDKWHPVSEPPKENGYYLCQKPLWNDNVIMEVLRYCTDLYKVDDYDFYKYKGKKIGGFYYYDSEWGYCEADGIVAWMELPPKYEEK